MEQVVAGEGRGRTEDSPRKAVAVHGACLRPPLVLLQGGQQAGKHQIGPVGDVGAEESAQRCTELGQGEETALPECVVLLVLAGRSSSEASTREAVAVQAVLVFGLVSEGQAVLVSRPWGAVLGSKP